MSLRSHTLLLLALACLLPAPAHGRAVRFGVSGGTVFSNQFSHNTIIITSTTPDGTTINTWSATNPGRSHTSLTFGVFADVSLSQRFTLRSGLNYVPRGSKQFIGYVVNGTAHSWERADYISVSSLLGVRPAPEFFSAVLMAGPRLDVLVHHSNEFGKFWSDDTYNGVIFGLTLGVDFALVRLRQLYLAADISFDWDLTDAVNESYTAWSGTLESYADVRNRAFKIAITLGTPSLR